MTKIVIEEINRLGHILGRHKFNALPVSVGRAYYNDLILTDVHVSPEHLVIREDGEDFVIEDKESHNGIKYKLHSPDSRPGRLRSGDDIIIGRTRLRLVSNWHPVADTHILPSRTSISRLMARPIVFIPVIIAAIGLFLLEKQLVSNKDLGFGRLLASILPTLVIILAWGGIWTFVGRVITHRANFMPHIVAATLFMMISSLEDSASEYIIYNLNSTVLSSILHFGLIGGAAVFLFYTNLTNSTNFAYRARLKISHGMAWSMLLIAMFMQHTAQPDFTAGPAYPSILKPPFAKLAPSQSVESFLKESEKVVFKKDD